MISLFDFFIDFAINIGTLFDWLFTEYINININGSQITLMPIGFLVGTLGLTIGILRRVL